MIETLAQAMEARWPKSRRRGRLGTPADVVLRMFILKHLFDWRYDNLEREVHANLVYRAFTRIDAGEVPDAKTILKITRNGEPHSPRGDSEGAGHARALDPEVIEQLHRQVVNVAKRAGVTHGRRFRIDTTVVETRPIARCSRMACAPLTRAVQQGSGLRYEARARAESSECYSGPPLRPPL